MKTKRQVQREIKKLEQERKSQQKAHKNDLFTSRQVDKITWKIQALQWVLGEE